MRIEKLIKLSYFGLAGLFSMTLLSGLILSNSSVSADDSVVDDISITVPISCTLSGTGTNSHTATVNPGTYQADIGTTTLKAICNDNGGFSIYAIGYTGEVYGTTTLIGASTNQTIATGTATSGATSNWAMKLDTISSPTPTYPITIQSDTNGSFSNYHIVPTTYTKVAERQSGTDIGSSAEGSTLTTTYATYVSSTQVADTYNGKVKYTLVHPYDANAPVTPLAEEDCPANSVCYAPNSYDVVGTMVSVGTGQYAPYLISIPGSSQAAKQTNTRTNSGSTDSSATISSNSLVMLVAPNYSRSGYGFAGWSTDFNADNTSTIYGPQETITTGDLSSHGMILYPVWVKSAGSLQDSSKVSTLCGTGTGSLTSATWDSTNSKVTATLSSVSALTDQRDNNTYAIAKLPDGNCWMIENLRLDAENSSDESLAQGFGGVFDGLADSENTNFTGTATASESTEANSLYYAGTQSGTATINIIQENYAGSRMPRYNNSNIDRASTPGYAGTDSNHLQWYSYGNYYTWASAMANTNYYSGPTAQDSNGKTSETVNTSICPKGWRLPYGRNTGNGALSKGFSYLDTQMGGSGTSAIYSTTPDGVARSKVWRSFPNNFIFSGYFSDSSAGNRGRYGAYLSSTNANNQGYYYVYVMYLGGTFLYPGTNDSFYKYSGQSIRCVIAN